MKAARNELYEELLHPGGGRWERGAWTVAMYEDKGDANVGAHENFHQNLNDLTVFGLLLQSLTVHIDNHVKDDRSEALFRQLVASCRITHETFATFESLCAHQAIKPRIDLSESPEYQNYFDLGASLAKRLPSVRLGKMALSGLARIAMNGPIPDNLLETGWDKMAGRDFRVSESPDTRFFKLLELLDESFWNRTVQEAKDYFGKHGDWHMLEASSQETQIKDWIRMTPDPLTGIVVVQGGGIEPGFATDVTSFMLDQAAAFARHSGMKMYNRMQRIELEKNLRLKFGQCFYRTNDYAGDLLRHYRYPCYLERLRFRSSPLVARLRYYHQLRGEELQGYANIMNKEGCMHVYLRPKKMLFEAHAWDSVEPIGDDKESVCFLRKQRHLPEGGIGADIDLIEEPRMIKCLAILADMMNGRLCIQISGRILARDLEADSEWLANFSGMDYLAILLDDDLGAILARLEGCIWLGWHIEKMGPNQIPVLFMIPLDLKLREQFGLFRPGTLDALDAVLRLIDETPVTKVPLNAVHLGLSIAGLDLPEDRSQFTVPPALVWNATRFINEEYTFAPNPDPILNP